MKKGNVNNCYHIIVISNLYRPKIIDFNLIIPDLLYQIGNLLANQN